MSATKTAYLFTVDSDYDGEPCLLGVRYCRIVPGNPYCRDSDVDYYGFREIDFDVLRPDGELWVEADEAVTRSLRLRELYEDDIEGAWR